MSTRKQKGPLLYIQQRFSGAAHSHMQDVYSSKQTDSRIEQALPSVAKGANKKISLAKKEFVAEADIQRKEYTAEADFQKRVPEEIEIQEVQVEPSVTPEKENQQSGFKRVKSFKEMNVTERLEYLITYPTVLPPVRCRFETMENMYQGFLTEYTSDKITIQLQDQTTKSIPLDEVKNVTMIGIKR